ncbi:MAG: lipase family protein [Lawsonella sp.]
MRTLSRLTALGVALTTALTSIVGGISHAPAAAAAQPLDVTEALVNTPRNIVGDYAGFYQHPNKYPRKPGRVIRTQDFFKFLTLPKGEKPTYPLRGTRVMYTSTTSTGRVVPTTGAILEPTSRWVGKGETPLIVLAPGTLGQGSQCAASKTIGSVIAVSRTQDKQNISTILNYETVGVLQLLAAGYRVFVVDYIGGNTGPQSYVNNIEAGHVMLDAARAATRMNRTTTRTPVGFWGYSQGGAASALGTTLHKTYAPEVNLKAAYVGAAPLDLIKVNKTIDGTRITAAALYGVNGFAARFPAVKKYVNSVVTPTGKEVLERVSQECVMDSIRSTGYLRSKTLTKDGRALYEHMRDNPTMRRIMDEQLAAAHKTPSVPVLVLSNPHDDIVPYAQVWTANRKWCSQGAKTTFIRFVFKDEAVGNGKAHLRPGTKGVAYGLDFMFKAFNGSTPTKCSVKTVVHQ